jgi:hypothetical protein
VLGLAATYCFPLQLRPAPPMWNDIYGLMQRRLYPEGGGPSDPLRIAEEYRAALGPAALESLVLELVRDSEWLPGPLHTKLLSLPWSDVLTTNWDRLLEYAAQVNDEQTYDFVRVLADIPRARSPRIVKLHGSMPSGPFVLAEEDYRCYPRDYAPFVNLVQQVLMENDLCLLGFSGDDPNFLHWSGWIRNHLGAAARRIYLVGDLHLSPARRKYLEGRNIAPVDLSPLVDHLEKQERGSAACALFLESLINAKPEPAWAWPSDKGVKAAAEYESFSGVGQPRNLTASQLKHLAEIWKKERQNYPGWLICPSSMRARIRSEAARTEGILGR